jgi:hypothetical protein
MAPCRDGSCNHTAQQRSHARCSSRHTRAPASTRPSNGHACIRPRILVAGPRSLAPPRLGNGHTLACATTARSRTRSRGDDHTAQQRTPTRSRHHGSAAGPQSAAPPRLDTEPHSLAPPRLGSGPTLARATTARQRTHTRSRHHGSTTDPQSLAPPPLGSGPTLAHTNTARQRTHTRSRHHGSAAGPNTPIPPPPSLPLPPPT